MVRCMANVRWSLGLVRDGGLLCLVYSARRVLRSASNDERRTTRVRRAATHNCVSTRNVCGQLDNVMNVDIFPNADITYDPPSRPPRVATPTFPFYHHALSSLRDDVRRYQVSSARRGMAKTPDATLFMALPEQDAFDNDIYIGIYRDMI